MSTYAKPKGQEVPKDLLSRLNSLSFRSKVIGIVILVILAGIIVSVPGDRGQLAVRRDEVIKTQDTYNGTVAAVSPAIEAVKAYIDATGVDFSGNNSYSGITTALSTLNRTSTNIASRFGAYLTIKDKVHKLLDGDGAIVELNTQEFRTLVSTMDTAFAAAATALTPFNSAVDNYNGYHTWVSASVAGVLFGMPQGYDDPLASNARLDLRPLAQ